MIGRGNKLMLTDFGIALADASKPVQGGKCPPLFKSPEIFTDKFFDGTKADVFAAGICLVEEAGGIAEYSPIDNQRYEVSFRNRHL